MRRRLLGGTTTVLDVALAVGATVLAIVFANKGYLSAVHIEMVHPRGFGLKRVSGSPFPPPRHLVAFGSLPMTGVMLTTLPLAYRRTYPVSAFCVIMAAVVATSEYATAVTVGAALFAAYCAVVYSSRQWVSIGCLLVGLIVVTLAYRQASPRIPAELAPALLLLPAVTLGYLMRTWQRRARDSAFRLDRAQAEHEAATARALDLERARIAGELHDVVTHNVSVMVVQAGAARQVLGRSPGDAREALLAIEASGRNAMTELRHLLSLLAPDRTGDELRPQPGLDEVPGLVAGVRAAGLTVELAVTGTSAPLPPGLDLAAYRVVQEALTNVIKHAGQARTVVLISWSAELEITVSNEPTGGGFGAGGRAFGGRGLIGLRERVAIYGGSLDAGPRPGGGWSVRASFPLEPMLQLPESA
jgi:signal transduction histidine kinase